MVESGFNPLGTGSLLAAGFGFMVDVANVDSLAGRRRGDEVFRRKQAFRQPVRRQSESLPESAFESVSAPATKPHSRTDTGTIVLHWISAIAVLTSIATGLRIASDAPVAPISQFLSPILPQGEIWKRNWEIVTAMLVLARELEIAVTAEGIETEAQLEFLREYDFVTVQGYLFSRPLPASALDELKRFPMAAKPVNGVFRPQKAQQFQLRKTA